MLKNEYDVKIEGVGLLPHLGVLPHPTLHAIQNHADHIFERSPIGMAYWNVNVSSESAANSLGDLYADSDQICTF